MISPGRLPPWFFPLALLGCTDPDPPVPDDPPDTTFREQIGVELEDIAAAKLPEFASPVGDVDGDGIDDLVWDGDSGYPLLYSGPIEGDLDAQVVTATFTYDEGGASVVPVGDMNGTGFHDLAFRRYSSQTGELAYTFIAGTFSGEIDLDEHEAAFASEDSSHWRLMDDVGDLNGDGRADTVLAYCDNTYNWESYYLFYGPITEPLDVERADASFREARPDERYASLGLSFVPGEDYDQDGFQDIVAVELPSEDECTSAVDEEFCHRAHILPGPFEGEIDIFARSAAELWAPSMSTSFIHAGDTDGDGNADLFLINDSVFGWGIHTQTGPFVGSSIAEETAGAYIEYMYDGSFFEVASPIDIDADGKTDIVFCVNEYESYYGYSGSDVYVFFGPHSARRNYEDADLIIRPPEPFDVVDVEPAGDLNGDGHEDLMVYTKDYDETLEECTYVVYGGEDFVDRMEAAAR